MKTIAKNAILFAKTHDEKLVEHRCHNIDMHWCVYKHEHNDWAQEKPALISVYSSYDTAKQKQKELLDTWAKNVCMDDDDETIVDYEIGKVMFKNNKDDYFQVDIKELKNED